MSTDNPPSRVEVISVMLLFVLLGFPLVGYLWETLNQLMSAEVNTSRLLWSVPVLLLLLVVLTVLGKRIQRWKP